jgi:hypothetical protein
VSHSTDDPDAPEVHPEPVSSGPPTLPAESMGPGVSRARGVAIAIANAPSARRSEPTLRRTAVPRRDSARASFNPIVPSPLTARTTRTTSTRTNPSRLPPRPPVTGHSRSSAAPD